MKTIYKLILKSYLGPMIMTFFIVMFVLYVLIIQQRDDIGLLIGIIRFQDALDAGCALLLLILFLLVIMPLV